jgi:predicted ATPase
VIRRVEALRYRALRYIRRDIGDFQILVGPNASGKSTFLDVVRFLGDLLKDGIEAAVRVRSPNLQNLIWMQEHRSLELAVELEIPEDRRQRLGQIGYDRARYEVALGTTETGELALQAETLWLKPAEKSELSQRDLFPSPTSPPLTILVAPEGKRSPPGWKKVVTKRTESGIDYFLSETTGWNNPFRLGPHRAALANLPEDEDRFPVATWVKRVLMEGIDFLVLNSEAMRRPSPPGSPKEFRPDGSNLPQAIEDLRHKSREKFELWIDHVRTALPNLLDVRVIEREEDRHLYLEVQYDSGLKAPSWTVSDGTLRLLALTLIAYLQIPSRVYLIEEPENGVHPQAVETIYKSLASSYTNQILCATHSPVLLSLAEPAEILCFAQTEDGAVDIVSGAEHPNLREWRREVDLGSLFATGVLDEAR